MVLLAQTQTQRLHHNVILHLLHYPFQIRLFCNAFRAYPSNRMDNLSLRLIIVSFILNPFTYVLFKKNFKRNLRRSFTELAEYLSDFSLTKKPKRQISRTDAEQRTDFGYSTGIGLGNVGAETTIMEANQPQMAKIENSVTTLKC